MYLENLVIDAVEPQRLARIHRRSLINGGLPDEQMPSYLGR